jgi:hypothetical protein
VVAVTRLLAIDPGNAESAYVVINKACEPVHFGKIKNESLRTRILGGYEDVEADRVVIEMVASYGMAVGADVFETCVWIGRFAEAVRAEWWPNRDPELIKRHAVKMHHCHSAKANDANITQALVDRFAPGQRNHGKGTKADPGWFYGFSRDVWQAYALAVYAMDTALEAAA